MKPKLLMVDEMTTSVQEMLSNHVEFVYPTKDCDFSTDFTMIYTGLTPVVTNATVFCPCTSVEHIDAPNIIHLDDEFKQGIGQTVTSTAEHTWWLIQGLAKMNEMQLSGKRLGVVGYGRIGSRIREYADTFGMSVLVMKEGDSLWKPTCFSGLSRLVRLKETNAVVELQDVVSTNEFEDVGSLLFEDSDIITLHVPLNDSTKGMIGKEQIAMMKDGALLVNTSRWQIVDEEAVIEALSSGKLAGYAHDFKPQIHLDTKERWNMWMNSGVNDKVIATPHIGGKCREAREITDKYIADKIIEFINK